MDDWLSDRLEGCVGNCRDNMDVQLSTIGGTGLPVPPHYSGRGCGSVLHHMVYAEPQLCSRSRKVVLALPGIACNYTCTPELYDFDLK